MLGTTCAAGKSLSSRGAGDCSKHHRGLCAQQRPRLTHWRPYGIFAGFAKEGSVGETVSAGNAEMGAVGYAQD